jgi:outer membrane cobalamin receptor
MDETEDPRAMPLAGEVAPAETSSTAVAPASETASPGLSSPKTDTQQSGSKEGELAEEPVSADAPETVALDDQTTIESVSKLTTEEALDLTLEELLNLPITAASKQEERLAQAPSSVTVFTRQDIVAMGIRTLERLLNFVPGFQGTTDQGNGVFRVAARGRSTRAQEYILVLVDGQRLNDVYSGGAPIPVAVENIQQVEIIRGPGSALYGANAFLGVVNIKTLRNVTDLVAGVGDLNSRYVVANFSKAMGPVNMAGFVRFYSDEGFRFRKVEDIRGETGPAYDPARQVDANLNLKYGDLQFHFRHMERGLQGMSCCTLYSEYSDEQMATQTSVRLTYELEIAEDLELDAAAALSRDHRSSITARLPVGAVPDWRRDLTLDETFFFGFRWTGRAATGSVDLRWRAFESEWFTGTLLVGGAYEYTRMIDAANISSHDAAMEYQGDLYEWPVDPVTRNTVAGYAQAKLELLSQVELTAGVRFDWYDDFGESINPRAALVYETPFASCLKVMYGRAFRAPSFLELYDRPMPMGLSAGGDPKLEPETVETLEVAYIQEIVDVAQASVTFFHSGIDNIIEEPMSRLPYRNLGTLSLHGVELELRSRKVHGFSALGSFTHLMPGNIKSETIMVALDSASLSLTYTWNRLTANINSIFRGAADAGGKMEGIYVTFPQPFHALLNTHWQVRILGTLRAYALVENILGHQFKRTTGTPPVGLLIRGRTFMLGIRAEL